MKLVKMALQHCKADHPPQTRPCRECLRLEWENAGLRQRLANAQAEKQDLEARIYGILAEKNYTPT
jgi:hypothetical protein